MIRFSRYLILATIFIGVVLFSLSIGIKIGSNRQNTATIPSTPTQSGVLPKNLDTPSAVPTLDPTANWKTYTNTKFGFEFKYPNNKPWNITENSYQQNIVEIYNYDVKTAPDRGYSKGDGPLLKIAFDFFPTSSSPTDYIPSVTGGNMVNNVKPIYIGGTPGVLYEQYNVMTEEYVLSGLFQVKSGLISFSPILDYQSNKEIVGQIFSTLKFSN